VGVTRAEVAGVAALAGLRLGPGEVERLTAQLDRILEHMAVLEQAPSPPEPPGGAPDRATPLRPDEPGADPLSLPPHELATAWADGFFTVPRLAAHGDGGTQPRGPGERAGP
jgi:Asp-tRNA(Asn)/Glu-tRNA(Gln) amidotransferase C subunit